MFDLLKVKDKVAIAPEWKKVGDQGVKKKKKKLFLMITKRFIVNSNETLDETKNYEVTISGAEE